MAFENLNGGDLKFVKNAELKSGDFIQGYLIGESVSVMYPDNRGIKLEVESPSSAGPSGDIVYNIKDTVVIPGSGSLKGFFTDTGLAVMGALYRFTYEGQRKSKAGKQYHAWKVQRDTDKMLGAKQPGQAPAHVIAPDIAINQDAIGNADHTGFAGDIPF